MLPAPPEKNPQNKNRKNAGRPASHVFFNILVK